MSEHEYLQTVQGFYQAVNDGNLPAVSNLFTDDIDWKDGGADRVPWSRYETVRTVRHEYIRGA
jgi:hypothetical protein